MDAQNALKHARRLSQLGGMIIVVSNPVTASALVHVLLPADPHPGTIAVDA